MISFAFGHRSGRVIATARALLALIFAALLIGDPTARAHSAALPGIGGAYAVISGAVLAATWNSWWLEHRLAVPMHLLDVAVAVGLAFWTGGYVSPFLGFSVFVILCAAVRWSTGWLAIGTLIVILVAGIAINISGSARALDLGAIHYIVRAANLIIIALMILWFSQNQFAPMDSRISSNLLDNTISTELPIRETVELTNRRLGAATVVLAWADADEPWLQIAKGGSSGFRQERVAPDRHSDLFESIPCSEPFLFDCLRHRALVLRGATKRMLTDAPLPCAFAAEMQVEQGIAIPIRTSRHEALLIATGVEGLCSDDLSIASKLGDQIATAFERAASLAARRESNQAEARLSLARDIHDGAIQFLAGLGLRIHTIKSSARDSKIVLAGLGQVERDLQEQQKDLHDLIAQLRAQNGAPATTDLCKHLLLLARRLSSQWDVKVTVGDCEARPVVRPSLTYQLDQLVREAVSNAVRHGAARGIGIDARREGSRLHLAIVDDGSGFPFIGEMNDLELSAEALGPRSIHERVRRLGGSMSVSSSLSGATIRIEIPLEAVQ